MTPLDRLSLNTATTKTWTLPEAVAGAVSAGIGSIGVWREQVRQFGLGASARAIDDAGLRVSSLCRGGFLTGVSEAEIQACLLDNRAAIEEAAVLGASSLVMVVGGLPLDDRDIAGARERVAARLADLVPAAREHGVQLALEPLHPMYAADRSVICTLEQALDLASPYAPETVAVVVDTFHVFWDPTIGTSIGRAGREGRIASYQVGDFMMPIASDALLARGYMGDGVIDFVSLTTQVRDAGYDGDVEVEIFNRGIWDSPPAGVVATIQERFSTLVAPHLGG